MIGICIPSRGLIHSRTVEAVWQATRSGCQLFVCHDQPIPECFNNVCQQALDAGCDPIMIVEEDIVLDPDTITNLWHALATHDIAYCNYSLGNGWANREIHGSFYLATGCIMFRRDALLQLLPFEAKYAYNAKTGELQQTLTEEQVHTKVYGLHDQWMSMRIPELGLTYQEVGTVDHWHVEEYGRKYVNDGRHQLVRLGDE